MDTFRMVRRQGRKVHRRQHHACKIDDESWLNDRSHARSVHQCVCRIMGRSQRKTAAFHFWDAAVLFVDIV
ncbi:MAG: hypothetical protein NT113_07310, partial [Hyphomicrobiales bacterium]|nr:hypothetical protein [Hyphomicrobiales bacterium]